MLMTFFGIEGPYIKGVPMAIPEDKILLQDLKEPITLDRRFDLAMSVEVAEHIPAEYADTPDPQPHFFIRCHCLFRRAYRPGGYLPRQRTDAGILGRAFCPLWVFPCRLSASPHLVRQTGSILVSPKSADVCEKIAARS